VTATSRAGAGTPVLSGGGHRAGRNARRFAVGHRLRLVVASDDQDPGTPAIVEFRHRPAGTSSPNTVYSASRLLLPVEDGHNRWEGARVRATLVGAHGGRSVVN
jgi:hypothetical protein